MTTKTPPSSARVPQPRSHIVIAIDGPAASGKSSTAHWVAERLGFRHVDSGALYRAATAAALRKEKPERWSAETVLHAAVGIRLVSGEAGTSFLPILEETALDEELRGADVTRHVSRVASMPALRAWVNDRVREVALGFDLVADGRDIGTVVFPNADLKVFLIADPWERARRRLTQRLERRPADEEIATETERLVQRDAHDATQTLQAKDAILIDTTYLTQAEQVERIVALAKVVTQHPDVT